MELALYCPVYGYYEREGDTAGRAGDYYTSVSVGNMFGELLAFQFAEWLEEGRGSRGKGRVQLVEAGAHDGRLAKDILRWLREYRASLFERMEYWIVEPSQRREELQRVNLTEFAGVVRWASGLSEFSGTRSSTPEPRPFGGVRGVIFSNELLDAMPVHRLGWDARSRIWFELGVAVQDGRFVWKRMPSEKSKVQSPKSKFDKLSSALEEVLPDGFTRELCPAAEEWWRQAASILGSGKLLTIDYGLAAEEFYAPERKDGTLRGYYRHCPSSDVLAHPGEQDITSHVNFSALRSAGEALGLKTDAFLSQSQFLTQIAARFWKEKESLGALASVGARQFQTLTHPEHLGRAFRVLIQSR